MPIYNTYTIHLEKKWESAVSVNFVDKDFDNPLENADEKGLAFAGMDHCGGFAFVCGSLGRSCQFSHWRILNGT